MYCPRITDHQVQRIFVDSNNCSGPVVVVLIDSIARAVVDFGAPVVAPEGDSMPNASNDVL